MLLELKRGGRKGEGIGRDRSGYSLKRMFVVSLAGVLGSGSLKLAPALQ